MSGYGTTPDNMPFCGCMVEPLVQEARWPGTAPLLPWHCDTAGYRGSLTQSQILEAFALAWQYWAAVIEITPSMVQAATQALVRKHFARIDGPSGTLAWSELANNTNTPKQQRYDSGDNWIIAEQPSGGIDLVRVACHEIGHVLGLPHDSQEAIALMAPYYSAKIRRPTERDIERMVALGYRRRQSSPTPAPASGQIVIDLERETVQIPAGWKALS